MYNPQGTDTLLEEGWGKWTTMLLLENVGVF